MDNLNAQQLLAQLLVNIIATIETPLSHYVKINCLNANYGIEVYTS